ncbi:hypothetical protein A33I_10615 [Alkalihalophilus marmarensis DSM 21297]|uniref:Serine kinase n=1 Tax=Alkalihalophilus marmarensis DSM 21297 TaxID=1188261 RepID=U6SRU7_9BACI|nr:hypothetical protein A33I_10615 [Alkalihalophilus marmarensis DSM 21297]
MRVVNFLFGIPIILIGAFLLSLTVNSFGTFGNIIMNIAGIAILSSGALIIRGGKEKHTP